MSGSTIPDPDDGVAYGFPLKKAKRVGETVRRVEAAYRNGPPLRRAGPVATAAALTRIWMPTGIGEGTFGTPASKTDAVVAVRSRDGWTATGGTAIPKLFNCDTTAVSGAKAGWAIRRGDGNYELVIADC